MNDTKTIIGVDIAKRVFQVHAVDVPMSCGGYSSSGPRTAISELGTPIGLAIRA